VTLPVEMTRTAGRPRTLRGFRLGRAAVVLVVLALLIAGVLLGWRWVTRPSQESQALSAGQRLVLASGISLTAPAAGWQNAALDSMRWRAGWLHRDGSAWSERVHCFPNAASGRPVTVLLSYAGEPWQSLAHMRFAFEAGIPPLAFTSPDGHTKAYWQTGGRKLLVVSHLPGHSTGAIMLLGLPLLHGASPTAASVDRTLATVWNELSLQGVPQPVIVAR
jgi:hypothetical protein